jgi:signal recognition particle receptor subunit beta
MAVFDPAEQRMCVRVVYDGAGGTGKTTNLSSLCNLFATQHRTELFSPGELEGRTLYFDWVQIPAGVVCGFPLLCQIISVPGQTVLTPRRRYLLSTADVVVLVCDSSPAGCARAKESLLLIDEMNGERPVPLVVQANKQDQMHALPGAELLRYLDRDGATVVEAIAAQGIGVIDTFVNAVRAVSRSIQARIEDDTFRVAVGRATGATELLARLDEQAVDPEWAAEMYLEEAQASMLIEGGIDTPPEVLEARQGAAPKVPQPDVETGFVWPAHTGRLALASLAEQGLADRSVPLDDSGQGELVAGNYVLRTSRDQRFGDREEVRQALVRAARERTQLDQLLAPETVLVAQATRDGAWWLWTIRGTAPSLPELYAADPDGREALLRAYAVALVEALRLCFRQGFSVDLEPESFGIAAGAVRYLGPIARTAASPESLRAALSTAIDAATRMGWDSQLFCELVEAELPHRLTEDEATRASTLMPSRSLTNGSGSGKAL